MSFDDIIFNNLLLRFFPKENPLRSWGWKYYNFMFFGYRNIGIRHAENMSNHEFLTTCDKLLNTKVYEKAEYYQVMSDLFKGVVFIITISVVVDLYYSDFQFWKLALLLPIWYRARVFSSYYVRMVKRGILE